MRAAVVIITGGIKKKKNGAYHRHVETVTFPEWSVINLRVVEEIRARGGTLPVADYCRRRCGLQ